jgi:site-specific recombinase XerD
MRTSQSFSILIWAYLKRAKNNQASLYARITINGKRVNISLNERVDVGSWNPKLQKTKGNGATSRIVNHFIAQVKAEIMQCHRDLSNGARVVTPQLIKARYLGEDKETHSLRDLFLYHNETMGHKLSSRTLSHYRTSQKYISEYILQIYKSSDMFLKDLDYKFLLGLENYLRNYGTAHHNGSIGNNTTMKHIQRLRKMINLACNMEWIERDPFRKFKQRIIKREREFLTDLELKKIEGLNSSIERITVVRDLFLFSCYTGISYIDIMKLDRNCIKQGIDGNLWIMDTRNKTGTPFKIPILSTAEKLIEKYVDHPRTQIHGKLMPSLSNQRLNSYLKEIADLCGITKNLTFHMARHTFATTVTLSNGVPIETVSKMLGHTSLATTQIYARVIEKKISEDMENLKVRLKK